MIKNMQISHIQIYDLSTPTIRIHLCDCPIWIVQRNFSLILHPEYIVQLDPSGLDFPSRQRFAPCRWFACWLNFKLNQKKNHQNKEKHTRKEKPFEIYKILTFIFRWMCAFFYVNV